MKVAVILLTIILTTSLIFCLFLFLRLKDLEKVVLEKDEENVTAKLYIEELNQKIKNLNKQNENTDEIDHEVKLRKLLDQFLKEKRTEKTNDEVNIHSEELREELAVFQKKKKFIPDLVPVKDAYIISQKFSQDHKGIDLAAQQGSEVVASASGYVSSIYSDKYFGNVVIIEHLNEYLTMYAHLSNVLVKERYFVEKGEVIGLVGNTGNSTNPHLHLEIAKDGKQVNPEDLIGF